MAALGIFIGISNQAFADKLIVFLEEAGYYIVDRAEDSNDILRKVRNLQPDFIILDYDLKPNNGFSIASVLDEDRICGGILLLSESQKTVVQGDTDLLNFAYLTKPLNKVILQHTIELLSKSSSNIFKLEKQVDKLKDTLETRKEVEKAKGILMEIQGIGEQEAFRRMQKQSMDSGIGMREIAKAIIITYKI